MAGIIIGSGSASFEIIRDLVEKLPVMIAPKWTQNKVQPIAVRDVLDYLVLVLGHPQCIGEEFEIGGPDIYTYRDLLLKFASIRGLKRWIIPVPLLTPNLSSLCALFYHVGELPSRTFVSRQFKKQRGLQRTSDPSHLPENPVRF